MYKFCLYLTYISPIYYKNQDHISVIWIWEKIEQAGAELGQAQLKLGLDFNTIELNWTSLIVLVE